MHGKNPKAWFLEQENRLYLAGTVIEGTGTHVEQLYQVDFSDDNATVSKIVDPYDVQQQICKQLTYRINDDKINLYADSKHLATVINSISQMGDFFPDSTVWVGEQLSYDLGASTIKISFVPGVRFEGSKALFYDDMPTLLADLEITKDGFSVTNIRLESQTKEPASTTDKTSNPYVGQYLDEDNRDPNLRICEEKNGKYSIRIGINRLTNLDDGVGTLCAEGLSFTATDASGNPITGLITVYDGNATVTFTNSTWELLPNNSSFRYTKQPQSDKIFTLVHNAYEKTDTPSDEKTRYYCSKDWKNLKQQIDSIDQKTDGIGFFEADYWYSGQDIDKNAKITDLKIERLSDAKAKLSGTLHNFSNQPIVLQLVTEEGEWKIDNFIFGENSEVNWKDMMENYVRDASRNRN